MILLGFGQVESKSLDREVNVGRGEPSKIIAESEKGLVLICQLGAGILWLRYPHPANTRKRYLCA